MPYKEKKQKIRLKKLKKGDNVVVIAGKDKGRTGEISRVRDDGYVFVSGVNMVTKHKKPNPQLEQPGGRQQIEAPIHHSNVALQNPMTGKPDRVFFKVLEDGKKVRCFKSNAEVVDVSE